MNIDRPSQSRRSYLFTVRVWQEEIDRDQTEWRGKVQLIYCTIHQGMNLTIIVQ